jgi:Kdo2-lipid IVA lauroyltransferase/acyltransferase
VKQLRYFFETALIKAIACVLPRLPRWVIMTSSRWIGTAVYYGDKRGRSTALENLRCAFGDQYTLAERKRIARGSYQNFARTFLDLFWATKLTPETWQKYISVHLHDEKIEQLARERGGVWVTPHFGNFEFVSLAWGYRGLPYTVVAQDFKNEELTPIFSRIRSHSGQTVIPQESAILRLMKHLKRGGYVGMLVDLNVTPGRTAAAVRCFGLWTSVPTLHVQLTQRLGLSIIPTVCIPLPDGRYEVSTLADIQPQPDEDITQLTQRVWDHFEAKIRQRPECWLWMYKHWRYRPVGALGVPHPDYPLYSNYSGLLADMIPETERGKQAQA